MSKSKKKLTIKDIRFSPELEVEFPYKKDSEALIEKHRIIRGWEIDRDYSLDNGAEYRPKINNKLTLKEDTIDQIKEIIGLIKAHKGRIKKNTCGMHVHIDMTKYFTNEDIVRIVKSFIRKQNSIYKKFNVSKDRLDSCQKIPRKIINKINTNIIRKIKNQTDNYDEVWAGIKNNYDFMSYFEQRDYGLNIISLNKHGTLEFRLFNGTINPKEIVNHVKWCIEFCLNCKK